MKILLAEPDKTFVDQIISSLKMAGSRYQVEVVSSGEDCRRKLKEKAFDILILDHALIDGEGLAWLTRFTAEGIAVPTVFVTATGDPQMSIRAMQAGVFDYINRSAECAKAVPFVLNRVVEGYNLMTQKVKLQKELIEAKNFLESIIDSAGDAIIVVDLADKVIFWNQAAESIFGLPAGEILGKSLAELPLQGEDSSPWFKGSLMESLRNLEGEKNPPGQKTTRVTTQGGRELVTLNTITPLRDAAGGLVGASIIAKDLTEQKKNEEKMLLAERLSSMGELMAGVAHEIRNPLAGIKINSQVLLRLDHRDEMERELLAGTLEGVSKIQKIVEDMLDFARPRAAEYAVTDLREVVEKSLGVLGAELHKAHVEVRFQAGNDLPLVHVDRHQVQQVLVNIMMNAIQAMERGGLMTIEIKRPAPSELSLQIADTGSGIPAKNLKRIFDPFFTTKSRGTGLGLSITRKILENHGARLLVVSKEGEGSSFTILFPIQE
jgi:PAS domain S-box-containing protein